MRLAALCLAPALAFAQQRTALDLLNQETTRALERLDDSSPGALGVHAIDLATGRTLSHNADVVFPLASTVKIAIMAEMFRAAGTGKFKLTDPVTLHPADRVGGSGSLQNRIKDKPLTLTVRELIVAMIQESDNTATNKCIAMTGMEAVNALIREYGLTRTALQRKMLDSASAARGLENIGTPAEMARLAERIYRKQAVSEQASAQMLDILKLVDGDVRKVVPSPIGVAAKTGELPGARLETAIVLLDRHPYVVSLASSFLDPGANPLAEAARIVHAHFEKVERSNSYGHRVR